MAEQSIIVWFRKDLRLSDNPALLEACKSASQVILLFISDGDEENPERPGAASRWWLHHSLESLQASVAERGSKLILRSGPSIEVLRDLILESKSDAVYWNRRYEPQARASDEKIKATLAKEGVEVVSFNSSLLAEPWTIKNSSGKPFQVFTPFWKNLRSRYEDIKPLAAPRNLKAPRKFPKSQKLSELGLLPEIDWAKGLQKRWSPGEKGAKILLKRFIAKSLSLYSNERDRPAQDATSGLSPHLHFGEIGPRQVWHEVEKAAQTDPSLSFGVVEPFLRQLAWREFAHHLLFHFPHTVSKPLRPEFEHFPWKKRKKLLTAWQQGETGYPIVDAGMRELWHTGTMHNRVRMVTASFLVKDLLQPWQDGAAWFWDTLVDADLANNTLGWQWVSGCGADAAPYFRVFNPVIQGEKFDPEGEYVKHWIPELEKLPTKWIHKPWQCPEDVLDQTGVVLGKDYPLPIVDHSEARDAALEAYDELKNRKKG